MADNSVGFDVRIEGLGEALKALRKLDLATPKEIRGVLFDAAGIVARDVLPRLNVDSGDLATSLRISAKQTGAAIRLGRGTDSYASFDQYGVPDYGRAGAGTIIESRNRHQEEIFRSVEVGLEQLIRQAGLESNLN